MTATTWSQTDLLRELSPSSRPTSTAISAWPRTWYPARVRPVERRPQLRRARWAARRGRPSDAPMSDVARSALIVNLLTEDNLPSYHHEIALIFGRDGAWGDWVHRWTAEEGRHGIAMRDYLLVTRAVDPVELERLPDDAHVAGLRVRAHDELLHSLAYVSFQELATRVSHRNTGRFTGDPMADQLLHPHRGRREPAHGLLPQPARRRARARPEPDDAGDQRRRVKLRRCPAPTSPASSARPSRWPSPGSTTCASTATTSSHRCCATGRSSTSRASTPRASRRGTELADFMAELDTKASAVRGQARHPRRPHEPLNHPLIARWASEERSDELAQRAISGQRAFRCRGLRRGRRRDPRTGSRPRTCPRENGIRARHRRRTRQPHPRHTGLAPVRRRPR